MSTVGRVVHHEPLRKLSVDLLKAAGVPEDDAIITTDVLVTSNLRGVDSHGIRLLPRNIGRVLGGAATARACPETLVSAGSMEIRTDNFGVGMVSSVLAMDRAMELASEHGIGWVISRNANHSGAVGYYALQATKKGFIGISNATSSPFMAAHGAAEGTVGNNPMAIGAPGPEFPVVLDMAMSIASGGRMGMMRMRGEAIPEEWVIKPKEGQRRGAAKPFGGPKGSGLAVMIEILTGVLAGGGLLKDLRIGAGYNEKLPDNNSHTQVAINLKALVSDEEYDASMNRLIHDMKSAQCAPGFDEVLLPGERAWRNYQKRIVEGIPLDERIVQSLEEVAQQLGVSVSWD